MTLCISLVTWNAIIVDNVAFTIELNFHCFYSMFFIHSKMVDAKSYGWENRVKFIVKFMYDIDNNGRYSLFLSFLFYFFYHWGNIREKNDGSELIENYLYFYSLDKNDFECLAVRNTVIEGKGAWDEAKYKENSEIMAKLWNEIADLADFDKVRRIDFRLFYKI